MGMTSTGRGNLPSLLTTLDESATITKSFEALATIFAQEAAAATLDQSQPWGNLVGPVYRQIDPITFINRHKGDPIASTQSFSDF